MRAVRTRQTTADQATADPKLAGLPEQVRVQLLAFVVAARKAEYEARSELGTLMTRHGLRWLAIEGLARQLGRSA